MRDFAELLDRLVFTPSRNGKLKLMQDYFADAPDPDRGYALAAIVGDLDIPGIKPALLRSLAEERLDPILFRYSYDYVGDLAETISLIWPGEGGQDIPSLHETVQRLQSTSRSDAARVIVDLLDHMPAEARFALLKLVTGGMRIGVSARLAKQALAGFGDKGIIEIEELWHGLKVPYVELFQWLTGEGEKPENATKAPFRPVMLSHALEEADRRSVSLADYDIEWKWDGIRVQAVCEGGIARLYSRTGDDISGAFPDLVAAMDFDAAIDGELLVGRPPHHVGSFSDLQQRLNRKTVSAKVQTDFPVFVRAYDLLQCDGEDLRRLPLELRRSRLDRLIEKLNPTRFDQSEVMQFSSWEEMERARSNPPHAIIEGLMLKDRSTEYIAGRPKGPWFKWKRDPFTVDAVLLYAQRGHGKRSSFYSDYTFGVWDGEPVAGGLVPVGKAYFGFTDEELRLIDKYVRDHTVDRFGPVRAVKATPQEGLVIEVAFEGLARSTRHKSGIAMRFPRISRLRWDKPPAEADTLETLMALLEEVETARRG
ncbi:cisplatin damage response ATP-dependent DNA ligase [Limoniibacter endophyticus]|nr:cisplatin damage response ATP-dependent DNA ligase [Limoniibacter endophyticus]